jgi:hypothetical protein
MNWWPQTLRVAIITVLALLVIPAAAQAPAVNLAAGRPYVASSPGLPGWIGLVDGDRESDTAPGCFATANDPSFPKSVTIDLGSECQINKVVVYNSTNGNTRTVSVACSRDGINFQKLRDPDFIFAAGDPIALSIAFKERPARYVRLTMPDTWKGGLGGDNCLFLREVEVYGTPGTPGAERDPWALAEARPLLERTRCLNLFRRYCLERPGEINLAVVGDWTVLEAGKPHHWAQVAAVDVARKYPGKPISVLPVGGADGAIAFGQRWAESNRRSLAPDVVVLSYGAQAAVVGADVGEFRRKYQALAEELLTNTDALVVLLTPPPFPQLEGLGQYSKTRDRNTAPYEWAVEQVAGALGLPVVRAGAALARTPGEKSILFADNLTLNVAGHRTIGLTLADLLM